MTRDFSRNLILAKFSENKVASLIRSLEIGMTDALYMILGIANVLTI